MGNVTSVEDPNGNVVTHVYNSMNEMIEEIEPLGVTVSYTYDDSGNQQTVTDALGHTTTTLYDALDRATTIISAVGGITTITYDVGRTRDQPDRPRREQNPMGVRRRRSLDDLTQPNDATVTYVYDKDGELTDTTDAGRPPHDLFLQRRRRSDRRDLGGRPHRRRRSHTRMTPITS